MIVRPFGERIISMEKEITELISSLASVDPVGSFDNPYSSPGARHNLAVYMEYSLRARTEIILIGEAPGYRAGMLTGIPFTCPRNIAQSGAPFFKEKRQELQCGGSVWEASSSAVWEVLERLNSHVLLWNVFPFHPYKKGEPTSNRQPFSKEVQIGSRFLDSILDIFQPKNILAVGRLSERVISSNKKVSNYRYVRHPSYGGKVEFQTLLADILTSDQKKP